MEGVSLPLLSPRCLSHLDINTVLSIDVTNYNLRSFHLLQNAATVITKCVVISKGRNPCYKMRRYYKMP